MRISDWSSDVCSSDLIGGFFDLDKWLDVECAPVAGSGETGSIRIINGAVVEPLIGATSLSYTYAQTEGPMAALGYHGTLACEPADEGSSMIVYTLAYDQSADRKSTRLNSSH